MFTFPDDQGSGPIFLVHWGRIKFAPTIFVVCVPLLSLSVVSVCILAVLLYQARHKRGCCVECGYDLASLASNEEQASVTCPECRQIILLEDLKLRKLV